MNQKTLPVPEFLESINPWQTEIFRDFDNKVARFFLLNWHRRARKTTLLLNLLIREAFKNPNEVYGYIAPTYTQGKAIVWRDPNMLFKYIPQDIILKKNESELYVELINHSVISIAGADNPDSIRGRAYKGVVCDEWALMKTMVWEEILRPIITQKPESWAMFAFTPKGRNHVYDYWLKADQWKDWYKSFLPVSKSELIPETELERARQEMPPELYAQEFECSFLADEENTLIPAKSVENLKGVSLHEIQIKRVVACDPSQGGDECPIYCFENTKIIDSKIIHVKDTMTIVGEISAMMFKHGVKTVVVDSIGIGAGIYDRLREQGKHVIGIQSAEKAGDEARFYNTRAEIWWYLMEQIKAGKVEYPQDPELRRELSFVKYRVVDSNGKIQLEPKAKTKETLGRSPDRADCFCYGVWALKNLEPVKPKDKWDEDYYLREVGSATISAMTA